MKLFLLFSLLLMGATPGFAINYGCDLTPRQALEIVNAEIYKMHFAIGEHKGDLFEVDDSMPEPMKVNYNYNFKTQKKEVYLKYETIVRPQQSGRPKLFNTFYVDMQRARNLMYVCLNFDSAHPEQSHLSVYFIEAHGLDPRASEQDDDFFNSVANKLFQPGGVLNWTKDSLARLAPLKMQLAPLGYITKEMHDGIKDIPVIGDIFEIPEGAAMILQSGLATYNRVLGTGISKVEVTRNGVSFFKDIDPDKTVLNVPALFIDLNKLGIDPFESFK